MSLFSDLTDEALYDAILSVEREQAAGFSDTQFPIGELRKEFLRRAKGHDEAVHLLARLGRGPLTVEGRRAFARRVLRALGAPHD